MKSLTQFILENQKNDVLYDAFHIITCSEYDDDLDNNEDYVAFYADHLRNWIKKYDVKNVSYVIDMETAEDLGFERSDFKVVSKSKIRFVMTEDIEEISERAFKKGVDVEDNDEALGLTVKYNEKFFYLGVENANTDNFSVLIKKI